jgi:O-antigen ligase
VLYKEVKNKKDVKNVLKWLYFGIFGVAAVGLIYYFQGSLTYDGRLKTFFLSPNYLAMYLAPGIIAGFYFIKNQSSKLKTPACRSLAPVGRQNNNSKMKIYSILLLLSYSVLIASFYLTYSYATWASVIISLLGAHFLINRKINKKVFLISLVVLVLLVFSQWNAGKLENLKNYSRSSLESRIMIWKSAAKILKDSPVWGIGPGNFQTKYLEYQKYFPPYLEWAVPQPHNLYLAFWLQAGILGIAGFLILVAVWLKNTLRLAKKKQDLSSWLSFPLLGIMLYVLIHGLVDTPYWKNDLAVIFWVTVSLGIILQQSNINSVQPSINSVDEK